MTAIDLAPIDVAAAGELDRLLDLLEAIQRHDDFPEAWSRSGLEEIFDKPFFDPAVDLIVARDGDGMVGWAHVWHRPSGVVRERALVFGGVRPELRGSGLGRRLLAWAEQRAVDRLMACDPTIPHWLLVDALEGHRDRRRLQQRLGFEESRWFVDMKRPLVDVPDPADPEGITIVPWVDAHTAAVREVHDEAFGDHWGSTPFTPEGWADIIAEQQTRLDLSFVALDGDRIVAYSLNDVFPESDPAGERVAWIGSLGTLRSHRRRGIAGALLDHSHRRFAESGFTHAQLDVDADSPTGAGAIYERHGYVATQRTVVSVKVLNGEMA